MLPVLKISRSGVWLLALVAAGGLAFPLRGRAVVPVALVGPSGIILAIDVVHRCVRRKSELLRLIHRRESHLFLSRLVHG